MGTHIRHHQEKGLFPVPTAQKINCPGRNPVCRMERLFINPRSGNPRIAFQTGIRNICLNSFFLFQPVKIIICDLLSFIIGNRLPPIRPQITIMQLYIMKSHQIAQRVHVHFSYTLRIISGFCQLSGHGMGISKRYPVLIPNPAVFFLRKPCMESRSRSNTAGAGRICSVKQRSPYCQRIQKRSFHIRMPCYSHTISTHLIRHNKNNIWLLLFHNLPHVSGYLHAPYILPCHADIAVIQNQLTEHGVCPGEPLSGVICRIIDIEALVHHVLAGIGIFHGVQDRQLFFLCLAGQTLDRQSNMPDIGLVCWLPTPFAQLPS